MPGMRIFGRRCALATDDFVFFGVFNTIVYTPLVVWAQVVYVSFLKHKSSCVPGGTLPLLNVCLPFLCVLFVLNWITEALLVVLSSRGTISQPKPRKHVVTVVYIKLLISVLDAAYAVLSTIVTRSGNVCDIHGVTVLIKASSIFQWIVTIVRFIIISISFDWRFSKRRKEIIEKEYNEQIIRRGNLKRWNFRLHVLFWWCTTSSEDRKEALRITSEQLALLSADQDLVASDVIAGLLLYRQKCLQIYKSEREALEYAPPISSLDGSKLEYFPPDDFPPWMNLQLVDRYYNIAQGVLGWPWYMYSNGITSCCGLIKYFKCFPNIRQGSVISGDNFCGCNFAVLRVASGLPYADIVQASFKDRIYEVPFFVAFDHETSTVIIVPRDTLSVDDVLTDSSAEYKDMNETGCPKGGLVHAGVLNAARKIKSKLDEGEILSEAFQQKPDYGLVVVGHSLGGSISTVLTLLLKSDYPNIRCFAFGPIPCINRVLLSHTIDCVFTVICGNDVFCSINYENCKYVVSEMTKCLKETNLPKYKIFLSGRSHIDIQSDDNRLLGNDVKLNATNGDKLAKENGDWHHNFEKELNTTFATENIYIPGRILHIRRTKNAYRLKISSPDDYQPLMLRPKMIKDHLPRFLLTASRDLGKNPVIRADAMPPFIKFV